MIPYGRQHISEKDIQAVIAVLKSDWLTQGPTVPAFESALCTYTGANHAVAVNSATSALHLACLALGLRPGERLWTSPISFVASANCGLYCGAKVDFVDIDPETCNISPVRLEEKLKNAERRGELPSVVVAVHMAGQCCDMAAIQKLADRYGFNVIEDASHAIGGTYSKQRIGSCKFSKITVFSFHPVKIVTTGEGGAAITNDETLARRMARLRSHGITRDSVEMQGKPDGNWCYQQLDLGFNFRMTDIAAALGISQLDSIDKFVARRHELALRYNKLLDNLPLRQITQLPGTESAWHLYIIQLDKGIDRKKVFDHLRAKDIGVNVHYIPIHLQPFYRQLGFKPGDFPIAEAYYAAAITLPLFPDLTEDDQNRVIASLKEALQE
ncbi:MAG: UDP-4-amino-4,6-dideoxy-N-acetyl-beta-L-altrosamine transaminase [Gammaproteobacteria bacterium]|nr:UDP-4-amino-4,6-dideoxy-N-acetyl-beta-L-altrosamine transaminase [Gammaproteobacteria bacterium]